MHSDGLHVLISMTTAVIGLAILAVIFSTKANTPNVLNAFGSAFSTILNTALSPITGYSSGTSTGIVGQTPITTSV
jgi:hypothetical protein